MFVSIVFNYLFALLISYFKLKGYRLGALITLVTAIMINVGLLGYFKYADFIVRTINYIFKINIGLECTYIFHWVAIKVSKVRWIVNIYIVLVLTGLWDGAALNFGQFGVSCFLA